MCWSNSTPPVRIELESFCAFHCLCLILRIASLKYALILTASMVSVSLGCDHCKKLAPMWEELAQTLKNTPGTSNSSYLSLGPLIAVASLMRVFAYAFVVCRCRNRLYGRCEQRCSSNH